MKKIVSSRHRIPFNRPTILGSELSLVQRVIENHTFGAGGSLTTECQHWLTEHFGSSVALPTGSCTAALEMACLLLDLEPGGEVILPSFGYPTSASAIVRAGGKPVFVDIDPVTMCIDPTAVENAVTEKSRAVLVIHYAGGACDMDAFTKLAERHGLHIIEDAASAYLAKFRDRWCGTIGTFGCFSFHETKNVQCGQGGALLVNSPDFAARAEVILEKGTDRRQFLRHEVDKYSWQDIGSSFALDEIRAAFLLPQLKKGETITQQRIEIWERYYRRLEPFAREGRIELAPRPSFGRTNGHIFWLKLPDATERGQFIDHMADRGIRTVFHYVPLHSSAAGKRFGRLAGDDKYTTRESSRLVRLPIFHGFSEVDYVVDTISAFCGR